ncbi:iron-containing redox enzyme family protein [Acidicapsa acidisoli]|uniref:iron-containing redox enzyme family protein n=1 Tax=Acidicapsa acidisoli TaxID=1615681 RepID=UPI0021DFE0DD|nr:iron-containing redox enzyme family protein [Acidicapsa acidisoli]
MTTSILSPQVQNHSVENSIQPKIEGMIDELSASLPDPKQLTSDQRRGIIARYTAVLEGNFIYWMAATLISVKSEGARPHLLENLFEEVRDAHPVMLRRFAIAAHAFPTDSDALVVDEDLTKVRKFLGRLSATQSLATMAFFEGFIQKFMAYLADLATLQGSTDMEYTDVHGVCDIEHTQGLFTALSEEMEVNPLNPEADIFEGVYLLRTLVQTIVFGQTETLAA